MTMTSSGDVKPLVSVILPTHNRAGLLGRAIRSVLAQSYSNLELIVVDDASTDDTSGVVRSLTGDSRLKYIRLEQNRRAAAARNVGIQAAHGELIAFHDDDDQWLLDKLEKQVPALMNADQRVGLVLCDYIRQLPSAAQYVGGVEAFRRMDFSAGPLRGFGLIATPAWLVKRKVLDQAGLFDERMKSWDDWELALRLSRVCEFSHVNEPLFIQDRVDGGAMFKNERVFSSDMQVIMEKHGGLWADQPLVLSRNFLLIGKCEATYMSARSGRPWLLRAIRHRPLNFRAWALWAASFFGDHGVSVATKSFRSLRKRFLNG